MQDVCFVYFFHINCYDIKILGQRNSYCWSQFCFFYCILGIYHRSLWLYQFLFNSWSQMLVNFNNFNFSALEWPNWQWSFFVILFFFFFFHVISLLVNSTLSDSSFLSKLSNNCSVLLIGIKKWLLKVKTLSTFWFRKLTLSLARSILTSRFFLASLLSKRGKSLSVLSNTCFNHDVLISNSSRDSHRFICSFAIPTTKSKTTWVTFLYYFLGILFS